ncbi:MAG: hypothetical protein HQK50_10345 [Oligoflexia bacterium]|nr:hypothetical protein [Oligoflexia bacterium]
MQKYFITTNLLLLLSLLFVQTFAQALTLEKLIDENAFQKSSTKINKPQAGTWIYQGFAATLPLESLLLEIASQTFQTQEHYDYAGTKTKPGEGESYEQNDINLFAAYGLYPKVELQTGARFRDNSSSSMDWRGRRYSGKNRGFESWMIGIKSKIYSSNKWCLTVGNTLRFPAYKNRMAPSQEKGRNTTTKPTLGDASREYRAALLLSRSSEKNFILSSEIGYQARQNFSQEIPYALEIALLIRNYFDLFAGIRGIHSLSTDGSRNNYESKPPIFTGPTNLHNSINRSYLMHFYGLHLRLHSSWQVMLEWSSLLKGRSTDGGGRVTAALAWKID